MRHLHHTNTRSGFTIFEMVLYVGLFSLVSLIAMNSLFQTLKAFNALRISRDINDSSVKIMERLTRDIKGATAIDAGSVYGTSPGYLKLTVLSASGTAMTVEYVMVGNQLHVKENGTDRGALMSQKTEVDALVFRYINTGVSTAIKTELHLSSTRGSVTGVEHFYNTSLVRGSY